MNDHITEAFSRMNLWQFRSFLLYGTDDYRENMQPYRETLKKGSDAIHRRLERLYPDGPELDEAFETYLRGVINGRTTLPTAHGKRWLSSLTPNGKPCMRNTRG